jgi:hypothetical protein
MRSGETFVIKETIAGARSHHWLRLSAAQISLGLLLLWLALRGEEWVDAAKRRVQKQAASDTARRRIHWNLTLNSHGLQIAGKARKLRRRANSSSSAWPNAASCGALPAT